MRGEVVSEDLYSYRFGAVLFYGQMKEIMDMLHIAKKGRHINTMEKCHIYVSKQVNN
jgi:hypothetical protein